MNILKPIDDFLNKTTMYRLTLYCVSFLWLLAFIFSIAGILHLNPLGLLGSLAIVFLACLISNEFFAKLFKAPTNIESVYITAFILASIIAPLSAINDIYFLVLASILAIGSKYILAIGKKHIFNPAAIGAVIAGLILNTAAIWWMGTLYMAPFVLIAGLLICRKIKRFDLFFSFIAAAAVLILGYGIFEGQSVSSTLYAIAFSSPILYLGSIMLTEPRQRPRPEI